MPSEGVNERYDVGDGNVRYADVNMGLFGPRFALPSAALCVLHVPGDPVADAIWRSRGNDVVPMADLPERLRTVAGTTDMLFAYLSHRDIQAWSRSTTHPVCSGVVACLERLRPGSAIVCSTKSAPKAQKGFAFLRLLERINSAGYAVTWFTASAKTVGLPHDAHYTVLACVRDGAGSLDVRAVASALGTRLGTKRRRIGALSEQVDARTPKIGMARRALGPLPSAGVARGGELSGIPSEYLPSFSYSDGLTLAEIVCPQIAGLAPLPVRLVSRHGIAGPVFKKDDASYALGPGTSASPLFAYEKRLVAPRDRSIVHGNANWSAERSGRLIVRLSPSRAVLLHGRSAAAWEESIARARASLGALYSLICRGMPPSMLRAIVDASAATNRSRRKARRTEATRERP